MSVRQLNVLNHHHEKCTQSHSNAFDDRPNHYSAHKDYDMHHISPQHCPIHINKVSEQIEYMQTDSSKMDKLVVSSTDQLANRP